MANDNNLNIKETMSRILQVRYDDLEQEKRLCESLFEWANENEDEFALAFSNTYLGDYYIARNNHKLAGRHLLAAKEIMSTSFQDISDLSFRLSTLLAIYYELKGDEQNAVQNHMDALTQARHLKDVTSECTILNNLAFAFGRHQNYNQALKYYEEAYALVSDESTRAFAPVILSNMGRTLLHLCRPSEAKVCFEKHDKAPTDESPETSLSNWCIYYANTGDKDASLERVKQLMAHQEIYDLNRLSVFENYKDLFRAMLKIKNKEYSQKFLTLMEQAAQHCGLDQLQMLEDCRIKFTLLFSPEDSSQAYYTFYSKHQEIRKRSNLAVAEAMKAKISLENAINQNETLQMEQKKLEREANVDALTQIYNRRYLDRKLLQLNKSKCIQSIGVIMVDIDFFKTYNDLYGHMLGDDVLCKVANVLKTNCTKGITVCRYGGDEFCCVCQGVSSDDIKKYIINVRNSLDQIAFVHETNIDCDHVTLSIGYACEFSDIANPYLLSQLADQALYEVKLAGRNGFARKRVATQ